MSRRTWILVIGFIVITIILAFLSLKGNAQAFNKHACGEGDAGDQNPHCNPSPTVKPTNTPTPTLKPTATPTPTKLCYEGEEIPVPCLSPTPTVTPTVTPVASPSAIPQQVNSGGGTSGNDGGNQPPPVASCGTPFDRPIIVSFTDKGNGTVNFAWVENQTVDKYSVTYGYSPDNLNMGEDNIAGNSANIDIHDLRVGSHVWLQVQGWFRGCEESSNIFDPLIK